MSKSSLIGLTATGQDEALPLIPAPPEAERQKLARSARRLVCQHGWHAFAAALQTICREGAQTYAASYPDTAAVWQRRAEELKKLP
jgi:hypothetical protein